jgi:serine/threonine protein kinase
MKATPQPGLAEKFIIPIAREVAVALKYVHEAGVIHRDIKCEFMLCFCLVGGFLTFCRCKYLGH